MSDKNVQVTSSPKELLQQLMQTAADGAAFKAFLQCHLADDAEGAVAPRYELNKAQSIQRITEIFAIAAGGSANMLSNMGEGASGCCRILLTSGKHDIKALKSLNAGAERVFEGTIWVDLNSEGQIARINLVGDALTPALAMGRQLTRAPA